MAQMAALKARVKEARYEVLVAVDSGAGAGEGSLGVTATVNKVMKYANAAGEDSLTVATPVASGEEVRFSCAGRIAGGFKPARARTNGAEMAGAIFSLEKIGEGGERGIVLRASYKGRYTGQYAIR